MDNRAEEKKVTVVAVDDDPVILREIMFALDSYTVRPFPSGETALKFLSQHNNVDIILLDIHMPPGMSGIEVLDNISKSEELSQIPVIFLTSEERADIEAQTLQKGAADYVCKPINKEVLKSRIALQLNFKKDTDSPDSPTDDADEIIDSSIDELLD